MVKKQSGFSLTPGVLRVARIHYLYIVAFAAFIIVSDASHLIPPEVVLDRWQLTVGLLVVTTAVWYISKLKSNNQAYQKWLVAILVVADILFAAAMVYGDRGMASVGAILFAVPIAVTSVLLNRSAIIATASLCAGAYALACIKYFVDFFNEGYKVQLYSTIGFYAAIFFVIAMILSATIKQKK